MGLRRASALILLALGRGHVYGFEIMDATGLASGTVYPALRRMERDGWVVSDWEESDPEDREPGRPERRVYALTEVGRLKIDEAGAKLRAMQGIVDDLLSPEGPR